MKTLKLLSIALTTIVSTANADVLDMPDYPNAYKDLTTPPKIAVIGDVYGYSDAMKEKALDVFETNKNLDFYYTDQFSNIDIITENDYDIIIVSLANASHIEYFNNRICDSDTDARVLEINNGSIECAEASIRSKNKRLATTMLNYNLKANDIDNVGIYSKKRSDISNRVWFESSFNANNIDFDYHDYSDVNVILTFNSSEALDAEVKFPTKKIYCYSSACDIKYAGDLVLNENIDAVAYHSMHNAMYVHEQKDFLAKTVIQPEFKQKLKKLK